MKTLFKVCLTLILCSLVAGSAYADQVTDWNMNADKARQAACVLPWHNPLQISRMNAIMHLAIHDALNAIDRRSRPYVHDTQIVPWASGDAAVATAARDVLVALVKQLQNLPPECIAAGVTNVEADYAAALAAIPDNEARTKGIEIGRSAAATLLDLRADDGSDSPLFDFGYPQGTEPGAYRFTDGQVFAFGPLWGQVTPFALRAGSQFRSVRPYQLTSRNYLIDFNEVKAAGGDGVTTRSNRTADETEIALFWQENVTSQWNRIALEVSAGKKLDPWENARLFALLNAAIADAYIGSWETKYFYNFWRPETAIRTADTDGNPDTVADPTWKPLVPTPPIPDHDSGHSVGGGTAAEVLREFFQSDNISFSLCSLMLPAENTCTGPSPIVRHYDSFTHAETENGRSRILIGFHFRNAVEKGIQHGNRIGDFAVRRILRPLR